MAQIAVFGGGCFWCIEAVFAEVRGVLSVESGYAGGHLENPGYARVCDGDTGHAEVVRIEFDPQVIDFDTLLGIFFSVHDPTTPDRQGNDVGSQYRSIVLATDETQARKAREFIAALARERVFAAPIVTEVEPLQRYWPGEPEHQRYFERHPHQGYCAVVIAPKLAKFRRQHAQRLKA